MSKVMIFATLCVLFFCGCRCKSYVCADCSDHISEFSPYSVGSMVYFYNDVFDTISLNVIEYEFIHEEESLNYENCGCYINAKMRGDSINIGYNYSEFNTNHSAHCSFYYCDSWSFVDVYDKDGLWMGDISDTIYLKGNGIITDAIIERGFGITEFKDSRKNCIWKLVR